MSSKHSAAVIAKKARKTLQMEDGPNVPIPPFYLEAFGKHLQKHPYDDNFIVNELEGYGSVCCMEDNCWVQINLTADMSRLDGGRENGFGSLWAFQEHCKTPDHVKGRNDRCKKMGIKMEGPTHIHTSSSHSSSSARPSIPSSSSFFTPAGPSRAAYTSSMPPSGSSKTAAKRASRPSILDALGSSAAKPVHVDSSSSQSPSPPLVTPSTFSRISAGSGVKSSPTPTFRKPTTAAYGIVKREVPHSEAFAHAAGGDDDGIEEIYQQDKAFKDIFMSKPAAPSPLPASVASASATSRTPSAKAASTTLKDFYHSILLELQAGKNGMGTDSIPDNLIGQMYAAELQHLLKSLVNFIDDRHKLQFRVILTRMKFLKETIERGVGRPPATYVKPPVDIKLTLPTLNDIVAVGFGHMSAAALRPPGTRGPVACGCGHANHYADYTTSLHPNAYDLSSALPASSSKWERHIAGPSSGYNERAGLSDMLRRDLGLGPGGMHDLDEDSDDDNPFMRRQSTAHTLTTFFHDNMKDFLADTTVDGALGYLKLKSLKDYIPGLKIQLMPHQVLGVAFMIEKEKDHNYKGGINADSMGLGKTVQSIATIIANPSVDPKCKTTLIVAPLALLGQWKNEIESKTTDSLLKVYIHHGPKRLTSVAALREYDVVLTTYGMLISENPDPSKGKNEKQKKKAVADANGVVSAAGGSEFEDGDGMAVKKTGPLMKVKWYRVILDEAHQIRNRNTRATKACFALRSYLRWSLTGTLVVNTLDDVFAHLHFLNISPSSQWEMFRDTISRVQKKSPNLATKRVQAILRLCCVRRHKESVLNGKKLLELPPKETKVIDLVFSDDERQIYTAIENRYRITFNRFLKQGTVMKNYSMILVMLTRLRQLTCHPWLLREDPNNLSSGGVVISDDDLFGGIVAVKTDDISEQARAQTLIGQDYVDKVKILLADRQKRLEEAPYDNADEAGEGECSVCYEQYNDERITPCCHSFCAECLENIFNSAQGSADLSDEDVQAGRRKCPLCRSVMDKYKVFRASAFLPPVKDEDGDEEDNWGSQAEEDGGDDQDIKKLVGISDKQRGKRRAIELTGHEDKKRKVKGEDGSPGAETKPEDLKDAMDIQDVLPSTKMIKLGDLIDQIIAQDPSQKVIVFSQFVEYIKLISIYLRRRDISHVKYVGAMGQPEREETIKIFNRPMEEEGSPRVILMSLKCGGVGLNLCAANHVICLDLAWNAATENQAVDRAHRIGQTREVTVHRLIVQDTIDQRLMELQNQKQSLSDGAMGEGAAAKLGRMSVNDLIRLFGVSGGGD